MSFNSFGKSETSVSARGKDRPASSFGGSQDHIGSRRDPAISNAPIHCRMLDMAAPHNGSRISGDPLLGSFGEGT